MKKDQGQPKASPKSVDLNNTNIPASFAERIALADKIITQSACKRVLHRIAENPHCWTHHISRDCAVINVPDVVMRMKSDLVKCGLYIYCYLPAKEERLTNRYGEASQVHKWAIAATETSQKACIA